jgi:hypothetical protein
VLVGRSGCMMVEIIICSLSLSLSLFACIISETTESVSVEFSILGLRCNWCDGHPFVL